MQRKNTENITYEHRSKDFYKTLANWIYYYIQKIVYYDQIGFSYGMQDCLIYKHQTMQFIITEERRKTLQ